MVDNTTELLSMIVKAMSMNDTEITDVKIYEQAVEVNNKVKICITNRGYFTHRVNEGEGVFCYLESDMLTKVLNILFEEDNEYEKPTSLKLIRLLSELAYDDLTEQERRDLEIEVGSLALDYKKELEDKGEI